jgi:hypothetical protein
MAETQSTRNRFNPFATKEKRDTVVDTALDAVDTSLKLLDVAADFLPVAGVSTVVLVLRSMMEQIRVSMNLSICLCGVTDVETEYTHK